MKAALLVRPRNFSIEEMEKPEIGDDEILVRNIACGICEGDTHVYLGEEWDTAFPWVERFLGHESSGVIEKVGSRVSEFKVGDKVTIIGGGFAEYVKAPAKLAVKLPSNVNPIWALGEPLACAIAAGWRSKIKLGDKVAIIGSGFMGLLMLQLVKILGAAKITVLDILDWRLEKAKQLGADEVYNSLGKTPKDINKEIDEMDVVIEATGLQEGLDIATDLIVEHGTIVIFGYHQNYQGYRKVNMKVWNWKSIDVVNGHIRNMDKKVEAMKAGVNLLGAGRLHMASLVKQYTLQEVNQAFEEVIQKKNGIFKASISF